MPTINRRLSRIPCVLLALGTSGLLAAATLIPPNVTVGQNLETPAMVTLSEPAPKGGGGATVTIKSEDPTRLLISKNPEAAGSAEISMKVPEGLNSTQEFFVQALAGGGAVKYTASASGYESGTGAVTLAPSAILISGPSRGSDSLRTTPHGWASRISIYSAQLDGAGKFVIVQAIRGGFSAKVNIVSSAPACGAIAPDTLVIPGGSATEATQFTPSGLGETVLSVEVPTGFSKAAQFASLKAIVAPPGMSVADLIPIGHNLEVNGSVVLGEAAPAGGLSVTLTTNDASKLLLSVGPEDVGSKSITVKIPVSVNSTGYFLHGIGDSGAATYVASAPGFRDAKGTVNLRPSGILISGPTGPPDEAEVLRPNAPMGPNGLFSSLAEHKPTPVIILTASLDPVTHRGADITLQPLRGGLSLKIDLKNSNPSIGTVTSSVTIKGGMSQGGAEFVPLALGTTLLSVVSPEGYTTPTNAQTLTAIVRK